MTIEGWANPDGSGRGNWSRKTGKLTRVWCRTCLRTHYRLTPHAGPLEPIGMDWQQLAADCLLGIATVGLGVTLGILWLIVAFR